MPDTCMSNSWKNTWQKTPDTLSLSKDHIDIWLCDLKQLSGDINNYYSILSEDERERADNLKVEDKKQQFIITRGALRQRLSLLTNIDPKDFVFEYLEHGKPVLANNHQCTDITFNVSHSNDLALIAIAHEQSIGIDIEKINHESDHQALMTRFFSKAEQTEFQTMPDTNKARAFCACWTRKEAFIKAVAYGVSYGLDKFDVAIDPENQTPEINLHKPSEEIWSAINLPINDEYMACLVSDKDSLSVRCWC
jgi:4'-phosphopantetheinyl transferase